MTGPAVSAVIVNYNAGDELRAALVSIASELDAFAWEAFVVDNASTDGSHTITEEFAPRATLIRNRENVGFGRGANQGMAAASAPLVLVMNPDCRLGIGAVARLREELARHGNCALAGPRILNSDGTVQGSARGDPNMLTGLFGRASALRRMLPQLGVSRRNVVAPDADAHSMSVDWVSGACLLARREALRAVGGFDERYFLYWEDADLCRRLRHLGWTIRYVPEATAIHRVGHSSRTARPSSIRAFHRGAYLYYRTHVAPRRLDPRRPMARALLTARCWWLLRS